MASLHAVLWDVDGTLADSEPLHEEALVQSLISFGIDPLLVDKFRGCSEDVVHAALRRRYPHLPDYQSFVAKTHAWYLEHTEKIKAFACSIDALKRYADQGRRQAAVSNSPTKLVDATLKQLGITQLFECVISFDGKGEPKPSPAPYQRALDHLERSSAEAIAVEDSKVGCASAQAAGLFVVGLPENGTDINAQVHFERMPQLDPEELMAGHV